MPSPDDPKDKPKDNANRQHQGEGQHAPNGEAIA
jgi:hypothetical protein